MRRFLLGVTACLMCAAAMIDPGTAATLDDVMARLDSLQRDNQTLHRHNEEMRKEIAALRQQRSAAPQAVDTRNAPSRQLPPAASSAMAAVPVNGRYAEPAQAFSWSGFYVGLHAGYGWGSNEWSSSRILEAPLFTGSSLSPETNGVLGGIQAGANYQFGSWVLGIEADVAFMDADGRDNGTLSERGFVFPEDVLTGRTQIDWLATFTGRAGYAFDRSLFYVKGGVAAAGYKNTFTGFFAPDSFGDFGTKESTRVGWTVGTGWEYALTPNWSAKIEYNYLDFGSTSETFTTQLDPGLSTSFPLQIEHILHIVKAGVNYRF